MSNSGNSHSDPTAQAAPTVRQEKTRASTEVTEVGPGILRSQLPIDLPGLGHVNCYFLEDQNGLAVVDPGLPGEASWDALQQRLGQAGYTVQNIHTVVITHSHHDHFGGTARILDATQAEVLTHERFATMWDNLDEPEFLDMDGNPLPDPESVAWDQRQLKTPWGTGRKPPPARIMRQIESDGGDMGYSPTPTIRVADRDPVRLSGRDWFAVHTPGHTADHLCLWDPERQIMLSGDHVLPTITPHVGGMFQDVDPLHQFLTSQERMKDFDATIVLPAHGHPFGDLGGRAQEIVEHHQERLDELLTLAGSGEHATVPDYMRELFKERSWGSMAESETFSHLDYLRRKGQLVAGDASGLMTFALPSS